MNLLKKIYFSSVYPLKFLAPSALESYNRRCGMYKRKQESKKTGKKEKKNSTKKATK